MVKISACIATWKRADKLKDIILLLEDQTIPQTEYEIVIVDSKSPDHTKRTVKDLQQQFDNIVYVEDADNVLAAKRNVGVETAKGDIIIFMDDDVYPTHGFIEAHLKANAHPERTFFCGQIRFPQEDVDRSNYYFFRDRQHLKETDIGKDLPFNNIVVMNLSFRKEYYEITGKVDERFIGYGCEDIEFGWRVKKAGFHIKYLPDALAIHREDSSSIVEYGNKLYKSGLYGNRILKEVSPEAHAALTGRVKNLGYVFSLKPIRTWLEKVLLKTDNQRNKCNYKLYKAYFYSRSYQGRRDQKKVKPLNLEAVQKGW